MTSQKQNSGFTLIELLVVISIMGLMSTLLVINFNGQRGIRNLKIAQSQLVTNIRKTQSYVLSARDVAPVNGITAPGKYYLLKFDKNSNQYSIQSVDTAYNLNSSVETDVLPQGITISNLKYTTAAGVDSFPLSAQAAYASPYAKLYVYTSEDTGCVGATTFVTVSQNPGCMLNLTNRQLVITLQDQNSTATKTVTIYGISGNVEASP